MNKYGLNIIWSEEDQGYIATCPEFPGLSAFGESFEKAVAEAKLAQELFVETYQSEGVPLPIPQSLETYSGQFRLRIPSTLHAQLARMAEAERVSLNQYVLMVLASQVGGEKTAKRFEAWLDKVEKRLVKVTAANNAEYVVALMKAWDRQTLVPLQQCSTASGFQDILVTRTEELEMV